MTLTDDIAEAEQRAREAVNTAWRHCAEAGPHDDPGNSCESDADTLLNRYAAVCRIAGRWAQMLAYGEQPQFIQDNIRAELARLMADRP